ncbi:MAG: hypothetical protein IPO15_14810 [Anaerolineae bacterium]|uniref:hypothetical protein n=1 Tax=Candidatus Amarolinea dominans TaxID=3140696 RepID=UPI003134E19D|nr:hypothetical protein [Anaerolineae bacterium]
MRHGAARLKADLLAVAQMLRDLEAAAQAGAAGGPAPMIEVRQVRKTFGARSGFCAALT